MNLVAGSFKMPARQNFVMARNFCKKTEEEKKEKGKEHHDVLEKEFTTTRLKKDYFKK